MIIDLTDPQQLIDAAEEWTVLAEEAGRQRKYKLAKACKDHATLYKAMASALDNLHRSRGLLSERPRNYLRAVGSTGTDDGDGNGG